MKDSYIESVNNCLWNLIEDIYNYVQENNIHDYFLDDCKNLAYDFLTTTYEASPDGLRAFLNDTVISK